MQTKLPKSIAPLASTDLIYAALDLHCAHSVLGSMEADGRWRGTQRFATSAEALKTHVAALGGERVWLALEASALTRWAVSLLRPLVGRLVVCDARHNRLISGNRNKNDEQDVADLCLLLRLGKLKEVWMGEDPTRFEHRGQLIKYGRLAITQQSSDGKPLGYQRLERAGHRELKTLSYHAWRTATKSTTRSNAVQSYYRASQERTHDTRHARLNTQRKILEALWLMWRRRESFQPELFFPATGQPAKAELPSVPALASG